MHAGVVFLCVKGHAAEGLEGVIGEDVDAAVVSFEVVDLLAEEEGPEVFAEEFDAIEGGGRAGGVAGETACFVSDLHLFNRSSREIGWKRGRRKGG